MTTLAVVQARAGSTRLPGKVLMPIAGRPMLAFMLARLETLHVDHLVVATSTDGRDDAVADVATAAGVPVVRGSESDVLARFVDALDAHPADVVVRLTADCPLIDPALVDQALAVHRACAAEYTSNTLVRTFPDGLDVEVVSAPVLRQAAAEATDPVEREHVTPFVYRRPERFRLAAFRASELLGDERWTVDTAADLDRVRQIVARLADPERAGWRDILTVAGRAARPAANGVWFRPAVEGDDPVIDALDPASARRRAPVGRHLDDPSIRTWVAERAGRVVGWSQVAVRAGTGHVQGWTEDDDRAGLVRLTERAMGSDRQVRELVDDGIVTGRSTHD